MITDTIEPVAPPEPKRCNLLLHQGANAVSRGEVAETPTPRPTATWQPVPHLRVLQTVERALLGRGVAITGQSHGLSHDNAVFGSSLGCCFVAIPVARITRVDAWRRPALSRT